MCFVSGRRSAVLYCIVLYCIVLYCIVLYCIVLYCIVLYCIVLYAYDLVEDLRDEGDNFIDEYWQRIAQQAFAQPRETTTAEL